MKFVLTSLEPAHLFGHDTHEIRLTSLELRQSIRTTIRMKLANPVRMQLPILHLASSNTAYRLLKDLQHPSFGENKYREYYLQL